MGLDIDLGKFERDEIKNVISENNKVQIPITVDGVEIMLPQRSIDYFDGDKIFSQSAWLRKNYLARDVLMDLTKGEDQCTFYLLELSQVTLVKEKIDAILSLPVTENSRYDEYDIEAAGQFKKSLEELLTDFDWTTEVMAFKWIS